MGIPTVETPQGIVTLGLPLTLNGEVKASRRGRSARYESISS
jgi:hypothetical protein